MEASGRHETHHASAAQHAGGTVLLLERLDNVAHIVVAAFFILMAATVILHMACIFVRQVPLIGQLPPIPQTATETGPAPTAMPPSAHGAANEATPGGHTAVPGASGSEAHTEEITPVRVDPFVKNSLELLSNILFVVILLELLRTIITYLETHNIEAIMQEFLVVGIISSVRKILLVGAEASLIGSKGMEFIQEATGVVIDIIGILLLILGLVMLKRAFGSKTRPEEQEM